MGVGGASCSPAAEEHFGSWANDARLGQVSPAGKIAREILPYVVILWATFVLICGPVETMSHTADGGGAIEAGAAICAITVAHLIRVASGRIRPLLRRVLKLAPIYLGSLRSGPSDAPYD